MNSHSISESLNVWFAREVEGPVSGWMHSTSVSETLTAWLHRNIVDPVVKATTGPTGSGGRETSSAHFPISMLKEYQIGSVSGGKPMWLPGLPISMRNRYGRGSIRGRQASLLGN